MNSYILHLKSKILLFTLCILHATLYTASAQTKVTSATFGNYDARQIGPAVMGGRITAIDGVNKDPRTYYVGSAGGGIWKTTNAGSSFKPIFDKYCPSIGDLKIDQNKPDIVWVGTGESNMRNSVSVGDGLYKTTDGGDNWNKVGLDSTEHIAKIAIDPTNSDVVYVAAPGALWSDSKHRGLYKTSDGGKTWNKILYIDEKTGCADVLVDPKNTSVIYASTWQFRRTPWSFTSGGKGSALYKSVDGGKTWNKIQNGFNGDELGRICLALAPSDSKNVYAIAESKKTTLYKSTDGGETWKAKSASMNVTWRPFYFSALVVDPTNPNRIYRPSLGLSFSNDGGETFIDANFEGGWVHSDHHALWIDPNTPTHLLLGTDGGLYQSLDKGNSWTSINKLPISQFYHVAFDNKKPYNVMGGLQDNGCWLAPSSAPGGVANKNWTNLYYGDGFWVQPDLTDDNTYYAEAQGGIMVRVNLKYNETKSIKPLATIGDPKLRFNWNTPICLSPTNTKTLYTGAQFLYKSTNKGDTWQKISPDLTTNNPKKQEQEASGGLSQDNSGAENHCTIYSITESPLEETTICVGTDDGNVQISYSAGKKWIDITPKLQGVPKYACISSIDIGKYGEKDIFITIDAHAFGDLNPYILKTTDGGETWKNIATTDIKGFCHKIKQDIVNPSILYVGTEYGLYISLDGGVSWAEWQAGVPHTPVMDIQIHPITNDVILATHGRGIIIIDDITPIRELTQEKLNSDVSFLGNNQAFIGNDLYGGMFSLTGEYTASSVSEEASITYYLRERAKGEVKLEIFDANNNFVTKLTPTKRKGINTVSWNMESRPPRTAKAVKLDASGFFGPDVTEGEYIAKLTAFGKTYEHKFNLQYDPNGPHSKEERLMQYNALKEAFVMQEELAYLNQKVLTLKDTLTAIRSKNNTNKELNTVLVNFDKKLDKQLAVFAVQTEGTNITGEEKLREKIGELYRNIASYNGKPSDTQKENLKKVRQDLEDTKQQTEKILNEELLAINNLLQKNKINPLVPLDYTTWDKLTKN